MKNFAALLDRLVYEPGRNAKLALLVNYLKTTPDPERGFALAAITGELQFSHAKPSLIRKMISERTDPVLFALCYDYVGDLSETVALLWPQTEKPTTQTHNVFSDVSSNLNLSEVVAALSATQPSVMEATLSNLLEKLDETGRWALLKLITGGLRIGVSARLAKTAVAGLGDLAPDAVEQVWHGLKPPYQALLAWAEGKGPRPATDNPVPFLPPMLAHAIEDTDFVQLNPQDFCAEWKWDGIRIQAGTALDQQGNRISRLYSRTGEDLSASFPDLLNILPFEGVVDGELLVMIDGRIAPFSVLQQRLNRKKVSNRLLAEYPAHIRIYDLLIDAGEDIRTHSFEYRRERLEARLSGREAARLSLSRLIPFSDWNSLAHARADPTTANAGHDGEAVEGCMIKRRDSPYLAGRPKGLWFKWKRDPMLVDAVLMYAQRGHGKRSSYYSDFTFGVWKQTDQGDVLVPVGKAYFGFTDNELYQLDRFVRNHTIDRHGPVRVVTANAEAGLVLEIAFDGLNRSPRHKSGVAMRFPRIARIRWDKPTREADRLEALEKWLPRQSA